VVGRKGTAVGVASRGNGRRLAVQEGGTRRRGARGGNAELRGGPGAALHGGSMVVEQGGTVGATGVGKRLFTGGGGVLGSLYSRLRRWTEAARR
jgi:hypothetical protein